MGTQVRDGSLVGLVDFRGELGSTATAGRLHLDARHILGLCQNGEAG